ncbi:MAG TPA: MOSC domain-containing protein [Verrucomicrobiae bacterium]|nr:MOSC domain-containing protein [Verrucomicrobiae bacterium]
MSTLTKVGRVASLHLHPDTPGAPLISTEIVQLVEGKGIDGDTRYFARMSRDTGKATRRQVTLMEREQIAEHAAALGLAEIEPGRVRSNIETTGIDLVSLIGQEVAIGEAILFFNAPRDPCAKMDAICQGLRERMLQNRQGVLAEVRKSGTVRAGDEIRAPFG